MRYMILSEVCYDFPNNRLKGSTFFVFEKLIVSGVVLAGFAVLFCRS